MSKTTKQAQIIETLSTKEGASIDEMMKLTSWQKHTVRGVLSRVIKKLEGFELSSEKQDADRRYYLKPTEKKETQTQT
jgi:DNA-binding MarR family transcriptional regulator